MLAAALVNIIGNQNDGNALPSTIHTDEILYEKKYSKKRSESCRRELLNNLYASTGEIIISE
jgi:hypothetical protein